MKIFYSVFLIVLLTACNSTSNKTTDTVSGTAIAASDEYKGSLPCADCEGIDVSLQLNSDSGYTMNSVYKGSHADNNNNSFNDTGTWNIHSPDTLVLFNKNGSVKYIKTDSTLTQLDGSGNRITGPLANMFILHKK